MSQRSSARTFAMRAGERRRSRPTQLWMLYETTLIRCTAFALAAARAAQRLWKLAVLGRVRPFIDLGIRQQPGPVRPERRRRIRAEAPRGRHLGQADEQQALDVLG